MEQYQREGTNVNRVISDTGVLRKRRPSRRHISLRIPRRRSSSVRHINRSMGRQEILSKHQERRFRTWAYNNAFTLVFLSAMFAVTWGLMVILEWT